MELRDLLRPFSYLEITHPSKKLSNINWTYPIVCALIATLTIAMMPVRIDIWGQSGIVNRILQFIQTLPGFYIAALAAVAAFGSKSIDRLMPGIPPTKKVIINNQLQSINLTRRLFLSALFSYLTALSITLTVVCIALLSATDNVKEITNSFFQPFLKYLGLFIVCTFTAQLITVTLWGLYYLGERMHIRDD
jgi:hypothetical protein